MTSGEPGQELALLEQILQRLDSLETLLARTINQAVSSQYISVDRASEILGVSPRSIRRRIREGTLRRVKIGSLWRVDLNEIKALMERDAKP